MGIHNTHMYERAIIAMAKQSVTLEVLSYHASASVDDASRLRVSSPPHRIRPIRAALINFDWLTETESSVGGLLPLTRLQI